MRPFIEIQDEHADSCKRAADRIIELVRRKPNAVIGLATGGTPEALYAEIAKRFKESQGTRQPIDFSRVTFFALDEYLKLPDDHKENYHQYLQHHLFDHINASPERIHLPAGIIKAAETALLKDKIMADDLEAVLQPYCQAYEEQIKAAGGIDLQILGIGENGHLAFNEPGSALDSRTRVVKLTESTREANKRFFDNNIDQVPRYAVTMGLGTLRQYAKDMIVLASGPKKAGILGELSQNSAPDRAIPASIIHEMAVLGRVTLYLDRAAAALLGDHWTRTGIKTSAELSRS